MARPTSPRRLERLEHGRPGAPSTARRMCCDGIEDVRQNHRASRRERIVERTEVHARHVERAAARQLDGVRFATELPGVIDANSQSAVRLLFDVDGPSSAPLRRSDNRRRARRRPSGVRRDVRTSDAAFARAQSAPTPRRASRRFIAMRSRCVHGALYGSAERVRALRGSSLHQTPRTHDAIADRCECRARR